MVIQVSHKYQCIRVIKRRPPSLVPLVHLLIGMSFGLCNAPATFQRCMNAIFSDCIENIMEVFVDDFSIYGTSFDNCLFNLNKVLHRCEDQHLVLNWEKCLFMVTEGVVLGHRISGRGTKVDRAKI